jgi:hypothetical protein
MTGRLQGIISRAPKGQQEEQPEKSLPSPSVPFFIPGGEDQGGVSFQIGSQSIPIGPTYPKRVFFGGPPEDVINIIAVYV